MDNSRLLTLIWIKHLFKRWFNLWIINTQLTPSCSAIYQSRCLVFWLPSVGDIGLKKVCLLLNIMEEDDTRLVVFKVPKNTLAKNSINLYSVTQCKTQFTQVHVYCVWKKNSSYMKLLRTRPVFYLEYPGHDFGKDNLLMSFEINICSSSLSTIRREPSTSMSKKKTNIYTANTSANHT